MATELPYFINKYKVLTKLNEGVSGVIYLVELDKIQYALKLLKSSTAGALSRFRQESSTLARLNHDSLIKIFDFGEFENTAYFVTEYLDGQSLEQILAERGKIDPETSINIVLNVAMALSELHRNNLIHRDIKPSNIFLTKKNKVVLIDLGLVGDVDEIKSEKAFVGTPAFSSPEQNRVLKRNVDFRSDIYSLGASLFTILTGHPLFKGTMIEILQLHASRIAPDVREFEPDVRPSLAIIITKILKKDPDDRYQSIVGLIKDLNRLSEIDECIKSGADPKLNINTKLKQMGRVAYVQRKSEDDILKKCWLNIAERKSSFAHVSGPSGLGKSRFCVEFLDTLANPDIVFLNSKCQMFSKDISFSAVREGINNLIDFILALPDIERQKKTESLAKASEGLEKYLLRLSKNFRHVLQNTTAIISESNDFESESEAFASNISEFLMRLCEMHFAVVFFIDDLQWLDSSSLLLLKKIFNAKKSLPLFLLGTSRNEEQYDETIKVLEETLSQCDPQKIALAKLNSDQIAILSGEFLGTSNVLPEISNMIVQKSNGNPLVAIEYLRVGIEQGFLTYRAGNWQLDENRMRIVGVSNNVFDIIIKRLEVCSASALECLQYCALYGNSFNLNEIMSAMDNQTTNSELIAIECQKLGLIEKDGFSRWKLIHDKIGESILLKLPENQTKIKSAKLANLLFSKEEKSTDDIFSAARLFSRSFDQENLSNAINAHIDAADLAFSNYAFMQAYPLYKWAYTKLKETSENLTIRIKIAGNLSISASLQQDEALALESINLAIDNQKSVSDKIKAMAQKVAILNNQSLFIESWDYFKQICKIMDNSYPGNLHWKILNLIWLWFISLLLQIMRIPTLKSQTKHSKKLNPIKISNLYKDAFYVSENLSRPLDMWIVSLRILILGHFSGDRNIMGLGNSYVGYCCSLLGMSALSKRYFKSATNLLDSSMNHNYVATSQMRKQMSEYWLGEIRDLSAGNKVKTELFRKYLSSTEYSQYQLSEATKLALSGYNHEAIDIYQSALRDHDNRLILLPKHSRVVYLNMLWTNLNFIGKVQESQKIKEIALEANNELRFNPATLVSFIYGELMACWSGQVLESHVNEIMNTVLKYKSARFSIPIRVSFHWFVGFSLYIQLKNSTSKEKYFNLRHEFQSLLRAHFLINFYPPYKTFYFCITGCYYSALGKAKKAEFNFAKAELLANKYNSLLSLFRIQLERARLSLKTGNLESMKLQVASAFNLAKTHHWLEMAQKLQTEFKEFIPLIGADFNSSDSKIRSEQTMQAQGRGTDSYATHMQVESNKLNTTHQATRMGAFEEESPESTRFINAMINVSNAFVESLNPTQQSESVLSELIKLFGAERGFIFEANPLTSELKVIAGKNFEGKELKSLKGFSETVVNKVFRDQAALIIAGTDEAEAIGAESAVLYNLRSIMATPLSIKGRQLGLVYLDSTLVRGLFTKSDIGLFSNLASNISVAFELSRMTQVELEKANLRRELDIQSVIAIESKKVTVLVDNMQQSLFSVSENGEIIEPVSRFSETIFGSQIAGKNIYDLMFKDINVNREKLDAIRSTFAAVYGEDQLQWDLLEANLPRKLKMIGEDSKLENSDRILKLQPAPIWDSNEKLEKILFVVEDVTNVEKLENQVIEAKSQAILLGEILESRRDELRTFFEATSQLLNNWQKQLMELLPENLSDLLRDLHTIKGNARLFRLKILSDQIHNSESEIGLANTKPNNFPKILPVICSEFEKISINLRKYSDLFNKLFPENTEIPAKNSLNKFAFRHLDEITQSLASKLSLEDINKLSFAVQRLSFVSIASRAHKFKPMVDDLAGQLNKKVRLSVVGDALLSEDRANELQDVFLHLIRNSVDHGLESEKERKANGKSEIGTIQISLEDHIESVEIKISDDGGGIDCVKVSEKAMKMGLVTKDQVQGFTEKQKAELIFTPNFSTKDIATDISGRGIGMDVVKINVERLGGSIEIESQIQIGSTFLIKLKSAS